MGSPGKVEEVLANAKGEAPGSSLPAAGQEKGPELRLPPPPSLPSLLQCGAWEESCCQTELFLSPQLLEEGGADSEMRV